VNCDSHSKTLRRRKGEECEERGVGRGRRWRGKEKEKYLF
jgi:hypothetical protein